MKRVRSSHSLLTAELEVVLSAALQTCPLSTNVSRSCPASAFLSHPCLVPQSSLSPVERLLIPVQSPLERMPLLPLPHQADIVWGQPCLSHCAAITIQ